MYHHRSTHGPVERQVDLAFTDRHGGVSAAPFDTLNVAIEGDDTEAARSENVRVLLADFAPDDALADLRQVHGNHVVTARGAIDRAEADALVSDVPGVVLMVRAADCVPVLLADPEAGVIGAAHAGRPGLVAGVATAVVREMQALGARDVTAWIGPSVCGSCYEVPADLQAEVAQVSPESLSTTSWGTPALDIGAGVRAQLEAAGARVHDLGVCTRESRDLYSYRRDARAAGRHAGLIRRTA